MTFPELLIELKWPLTVIALILIIAVYSILTKRHEVELERMREDARLEARHPKRE